MKVDTVSSIRNASFPLQLFAPHDAGEATLLGPISHSLDPPRRVANSIHQLRR